MKKLFWHYVFDLARLLKKPNLNWYLKQSSIGIYFWYPKVNLRMYYPEHYSPTFFDVINAAKNQIESAGLDLAYERISRTINPHIIIKDGMITVLNTIQDLRMFNSAIQRIIDDYSNKKGKK